MLRKCENCVNSSKGTTTIFCSPPLPTWLDRRLKVYRANFMSNAQARRVLPSTEPVDNTEAETCPAFRLRDIGEN